MAARKVDTGSDTGSVSADAECPEAAALAISMIEAMLRLIARFPGLVEKVAHAIPKQPGQSHLDNFNTMMAAISDQARYHPGSVLPSRTRWSRSRSKGIANPPEQITFIHVY